MTQAVGHIARISEYSLTRRAALTGMAMLAAPSTALAVCVAPGFDGPDPVLRLCEGWREIEDYAAEQMRQYSETEARVHAGMPLPDPVIVHGPEAEALRIKRPEYEHWQPLHNVIEPRLISDALFYVQPCKMTMTEEIMPDGKIARVFVDHEKPLPLTEAQQAAHDTLTRMLKLSREYHEEINRRMAAVGKPRGDNEADDLGDRQWKIERAIRITPSRTRTGLRAKIDLYLADPDRFQPTEAGDCLATSIARDARRLLWA